MWLTEGTFAEAFPTGHANVATYRSPAMAGSNVDHPMLAPDFCRDGAAPMVRDCIRFTLQPLEFRRFTQ
jgi:hypothetical protein